MFRRFFICILLAGCSVNKSYGILIKDSLKTMALLAAGTKRALLTAGHQRVLKVFPSLITRDIVDRAVRVKVTNNCSFSCKFCHNEGTELPGNMNGKRVSTLLDPAVRLRAPVENSGVSYFALMDTLKHLGFNEIHLTGGEPTSHPELPQLVQYSTRSGFGTYMTSNGQFSEKKLCRLAKAGLRGVTFSVLSLDPKEFLETQLREYASKEEALFRACKIIKRTTDNIARAKELGLASKINVVVFGKHDTSRVDRIVDFAEKHEVTISLLPSVLSSDQTSVEKTKMEHFAFEYALRRSALYIDTVRSINNSKSRHNFILPNGTPLRIKIIQDYQPDILCGDCEHYGKASCSENFYDVRIEFRGGKPFVRLCVQKSTHKTLLPLEDFIKSHLVGLVPLTQS